MRVIIYCECECDRMPLISYISIPQLHPLDGNVLRYERVPIAEICANKSRRKSNQVYPVTANSNFRSGHLPCTTSKTIKYIV